MLSFNPKHLAGRKAALLTGLLRPTGRLSFLNKLGGIRRFKQSSAVQQQACYAIGLVAMKLISFLLLPYVTYQLGIHEFARMETLLALVNGATVVVGFGLVNNLYRLAGLATNGQSRSEKAALVSGSAIIIALASFALLLGLSLWLLPVLNQYWVISSTEYYLIALLISSEGVIAVPLAWLRMQEHALRFLKITLARTLIYALLTVAMLKLGYGLEGILWASVIAVTYQIAHLLYCQQQDSGIALLGKTPLKQLKQQLRFGVPFVISGLAMYATQGLDIVLLSQSISPLELAAYVLAIKFFLIAALLSQPFQLWWYPRRIGLLQADRGHSCNDKATNKTSADAFNSSISNKLASNNESHPSLGKQQAANGALGGAVLACLLGLGVAVTAPVISLWLFAEELQVLNQYLPWLILAGILKQWGALFNLGCFVTERSEIQMVIELLTGLFCLLLFPFAIKHWGVDGVLVCLLISQLLRLLAYFYISQKLLLLPYHFKTFLFVALPCIALILQPVLWPLPAQDQLWLKTVWAMGVFPIAGYLFWYGLFREKTGLLRSIGR